MRFAIYNSILRVCTSGRLLYFLYKYTHRADSFIIDDDRVEERSGELIATYTWDENIDIPTFKFEGDYYSLNNVQEHMKPTIIDSLKQMDKILTLSKEEKICHQD